MLALGGFIVGYILGMRAGREGLDDIVRAVRSVRESEELQARVARGTQIAGELFERGMQQRGSIRERVVGAVSEQAREMFSRRREAA